MNILVCMGRHRKTGNTWTDVRRSFYVPHRANAVKVASARLAGEIVARFVI